MQRKSLDFQQENQALVKPLSVVTAWSGRCVSICSVIKHTSYRGRYTIKSVPSVSSFADYILAYLSFLGSSAAQLFDCVV